MPFTNPKRKPLSDSHDFERREFALGAVGLVPVVRIPHDLPVRIHSRVTGRTFYEVFRIDLFRYRGDDYAIG